MGLRRRGRLSILVVIAACLVVSTAAFGGSAGCAGTPAVPPSVTAETASVPTTVPEAASGTTSVGEPGPATEAETTTTSAAATTSSVAAAAIATTTSAVTTTSSDASTASSVETSGDRIVIAWQPSHQDDTGFDDWHEYEICGDIVDRTIALATDFENVKAWEIGMGLTGTNRNGGTNTDAFDSELEQANDAGADVFVSVHVDGGNVSGIMPLHDTGDTESKAVAVALAKAIADGMDMRLRPTRAADYYSLDPARNHAKIRLILEIGDNRKDRELLEDPAQRQKIASLLAGALGEALAGVEF